MEKIKITKIKSTIGQSSRKKATMIALGLRKMNQHTIQTDTPSVQGMIASVRHLVDVEKYKKG